MLNNRSIFSCPLLTLTLLSSSIFNTTWQMFVSGTQLTREAAKEIQMNSQDTDILGQECNSIDILDLIYLQALLMPNSAGPTK
jgi:hypothetical protein